MATGCAVQALVAQVSEVTAQLRQLKTDIAGAPSVPAPQPVPRPSERVDHHGEPCLPPPASYPGEPQNVKLL